MELLFQIHLVTKQVVPESIMTGLEQSTIGAIAQVYPLTLRKGYLFYLSKSMYRRVQELGLSHQYLYDAVLRTNIKMISALSFVPIADTIQAFDALSNHAGVKEQAVLNYIETNYVPNFKLQTPRREKKMIVHMLQFLSIAMLFDYLIH